MYLQQALTYERWLGCENPKVTKGENNTWFEVVGKKRCLILRCPAEELKLDETFDLFFTSPPYFATERYNEGGENDDQQSWKRYATYEAWKDNFLFPVLDNAMDHLKSDGVFFLNIMDPVVLGTRSRACDALVDHLTGRGAIFLGQGGMRIKQRPRLTDDLLDFMGQWYVENVWCFAKTQVSLHPPKVELNWF